MIATRPTSLPSIRLSSLPVAAAALALLVLSAAANSQPAVPLPGAPPAAPRRPTGPASISETSGVNLARHVWYFVDRDPAGGIEAINAPGAGVATTVPFTGVTQAGIGWMYVDFNVSVPAIEDKQAAEAARELLSSVLTLGDCSGADTAYLNGEQVGATPLDLASENGTPRRYVLPARLLRHGAPNRLAIRFETARSTRTVGLGMGPMTLAPLDWHETQARLEAVSVELGRTYAVQYRAVRDGMVNDPAFVLLGNDVSDLQLIYVQAYQSWFLRNPEVRAALNELESLAEDMLQRRQALDVKTLGTRSLLQRRRREELERGLGFPAGSLALRPDGFGRFGAHNVDGLPAVRTVTPLSAVPAHGGGFTVSLATVDRVDVLEADWTHKTTRVAGMNDRRLGGRETQGPEDLAIVYYMHASSLFPGVMLDIVRGRTLTLELDVDGPDIGIFQFAVSGPDFADSVLARYMGRGEQERSAEDVAREKALMESLAGEPRVTLIVPRRPGAAPMLIIHGTPCGFALKRTPGDVTGKTLLSIETEAAVLGRQVIIFPHGANLIDGTPVRGETPDAFMRRTLGANHSRLIAAFFRMGARFPIGVEEWYRVDRAGGVVDCVDVLGTIDLFGGRANLKFTAVLPSLVVEAAENGYPAVLPAKFSPRLRVAGAEGPLILGDSPSNILHYTLPLPPMDRHALPWVGGDDGLALLLDASATLPDPAAATNAAEAVYTGRTQAFQAWSFLSDELRATLRAGGRAAAEAALAPGLWTTTTEPLTRRPVSWTQSTEGPYFGRYDLEWGNALALVGWDTYAAYTGDWAFVRDNAAAIRDLAFRYLVAADDWAWMRPATSLHGFGTGSGDSTNIVHAGFCAYSRMMRAIGDDAQADLGAYFAARSALPLVRRFALNEYATRNQLIGPSDVVVGFREGAGFITAHAGDYPWEVVSNLAGHGIHPEAFDAMLAGGADDLRAYLSAIKGAWPNLFDGTARYRGPTAYNGNSGYVTLPVLYALARLDEPRESLVGLISSASTNDDYWWIAPPVLAEIIAGREQLWVADWGRLGFVGAQFDNGRLHVDLAVHEAGGAPVTVTIHAPVAPMRVYLNWRQQEMVDYDAARKLLRVRLDASLAGPVAITVDFKDLPKPDPAALSRFVAASSWTGAQPEIILPPLRIEYAPPDASAPVAPPAVDPLPIDPLQTGGEAPMTPLSTEPTGPERELEFAGGSPSPSEDQP